MKFLIAFCLVLVLANVSCFNTGSRTKSTKVNAENITFPYQAGLLINEGDDAFSWCSGTLIDYEWILTAAHCVVDIEEVTVKLGSTKYPSDKVSHNVKKDQIFIHSDWNKKDLVNDIALIRIPYTYSPSIIEPVNLPFDDIAHYTDEEAITSGWGHISESSLSPDNDLDWSSLFVVKNEYCARFFGTAITPNTVCISTYGLPSNCKGDTGGPLVLKSNNTLIGVSSFGARKGCDKGTPAVFTRVPKYLDWIKTKTGISN